LNSPKWSTQIFPLFCVVLWKKRDF